MIGLRIMLFFCCFGALAAPWPGLDSAYGTWIRTSGSAVFSLVLPAERIQFEAIQRTRYRPLDTRIVLFEHGLDAPGGRARATLLDLDMWGIGWVPTAFLAALVLSTPIPWTRRCRALAWGFCAMHAYVLLSIGVHILFNSEHGGGIILGGLDETLVNQIGPGFLAATSIWIVATFGSKDWTALMVRRAGAQPVVSGRGVTPV